MTGARLIVSVMMAFCVFAFGMAWCYRHNTVSYAEAVDQQLAVGHGAIAAR